MYADEIWVIASSSVASDVCALTCVSSAAADRCCVLLPFEPMVVESNWLSAIEMVSLALLLMPTWMSSPAAMVPSRRLLLLKAVTLEMRSISERSALNSLFR